MKPIYAYDGVCLGRVQRSIRKQGKQELNKKFFEAHSGLLAIGCQGLRQ
jgi:hypothetical protein